MELRDDFHQFFGIKWPGASPLAINILKKQVYNYLQQEILQIHHLHQEGQDPQLFSRPLHSFSKISWYLLTKSSKVTCKRSLCFCLTSCSVRKISRIFTKPRNLIVMEIGNQDTKQFEKYEKPKLFKFRYCRAHFKAKWWVTFIKQANSLSRKNSRSTYTYEGFHFCLVWMCVTGNF